MADIGIINRLKARLEEPLPGWEAQKHLMPENRDELPIPDDDDLHPAAVLIALFPANGEWNFPLIKRSPDGFVHSGQIALPGGRKEGVENAIQTALREAEEEISLPSNEVEILGKSSSLPIPVSRHIVQPVIGYLQSRPNFQRDPKEVDTIFFISLKELVEAEIQSEVRTFRNRDWTIPYFDIQGHKVWGATAMMLNEFRELVKQVI